MNADRSGTSLNQVLASPVHVIFLPVGSNPATIYSDSLYSSPAAGAKLCVQSLVRQSLVCQLVWCRQVQRVSLANQWVLTLIHLPHQLVVWQWYGRVLMLAPLQGMCVCVRGWFQKPPLAPAKAFRSYSKQSLHQAHVDLPAIIPPLFTPGLEICHLKKALPNCRKTQIEAQPQGPTQCLSSSPTCKMTC